MPSWWTTTDWFISIHGEANPSADRTHLSLIRLQTPPSDAFAVRRTLCHRLSTFLRTNPRVPFSRADELVLQQMGYLDSIAQMDILQLEQPRAGDDLMRRFRTNLVLGRCGETLEDERRQLRCFAIRGTPLVAGFVLRKNRPKVTLREQPEEDPFELAERLRSNLAMAEENFELGGKRNGSTAMPNSVGILLREESVSPIKFSAQNPPFSAKHSNSSCPPS